MPDARLERVHKQLGVSLDLLLRATREAESFSDQRTADALFEHWAELKVIHDHLVGGQRPRQGGLRAA